MSSIQDEASILDRHGYSVVPLMAGEKKPRHTNWTNRSFSRSDFQPNDNIGIKLGEPSGGLVDVDLDDPVALQLADEYLPPTEAVTGRASAPRSHRWYMCPGAKTRKWSLERHGMIVELRSTGCQTVTGPSIHPDCDEQYERLQGEPAKVDANTLTAACERLFQAVCKHYNVESAAKPSAAPQPALRQDTPQSSVRPENKKQPPPRERSTAQATPNHQFIDSDRLRRASLYLAKCEPAVQGQYGHAKLFWACGAMTWGCGLSESEAYEILANEFNPRCIPPWNLDDPKDYTDFYRKITESIKNPPNKPRFWILNDSAYAPLSDNDRANAQQSINNLLAEYVRKQSKARAAGGETDVTIEQPAQSSAQHFPRELLEVPGFIGEYISHCMEAAPHPNRPLALCGALALLSAITGRKIWGPNGIPLNLYVIGLAFSGAGKDFPGSPLTDAAEFPINGLIWDYNFRGDLVFLKQAESQKKEKNLYIEDGWVYFLHGWQRVIAEVFHLDIPTSGPEFEELAKIALEVK